MAKNMGRPYKNTGEIMRGRQEQRLRKSALNLINLCFKSTKKKIIAGLILLSLFALTFNPVFSQIINIDIQKLFSTGRSLGATYYHLIELTDQSKTKPYADIRKEYQDSFQSLSITDLMVQDLGVNNGLLELLRSIRLCLYEALNKQDLNEIKVSASLDKFIGYYDDIRRVVCEKYGYTGGWLLDTSFYTGFQSESISSKNQSKLLLSGLNNNTSNLAIVLPEKIKLDLNNLKKYEKSQLTREEILALQSNLTNIIEFFSGYPNSETLLSQLQQLIGGWQGILLTPDCEKHDIRLKINQANNSLDGIMDIADIAHNIPISDIKLIDDHFTFMFRPFGSDKFYVKFGAKLNDNIFTGEIDDALGEKGYWVLAKNQNPASFNDMNAYIESFKESIQRAKSANPELNTSPPVPCQQ